MKPLTTVWLTGLEMRGNLTTRLLDIRCLWAKERVALSKT